MSITSVLQGERTWHVEQGDNLPVMRTMPDGCIDLVFTSPPYNLGVSSGGGLKGGTIWKQSKVEGGLASGYDTHDDAMERAEYVAWQHEVLNECWRLLSPRGAIYYNHKPRVQDLTLQTPLELNPGLPLRQIIIWDRCAGINWNAAFYQPRHEWVLILAKPSFRLYDNSASGVGDVWRIPADTNSPHPAPFPLSLPLVALNTAPGDIVLDPFCGSGTTGHAALLKGKRFIGIDISEKYCDWARERLTRVEHADRQHDFLEAVA